MRSNSPRQVADQYKPAPGSPYRPVLSPPQKIYELQLGWSDCTIIHAFAGIDPPRSLVPAAALVPNPTPTSPQIRETETTSTASLKPVSGAVEAGGTGATRDSPAAPTHKIQTAGPRSTSGPSSSANIESEPLKPETSFNQQRTQAVEADTRVSKWQTPISPEAVSKSYTSIEKAEASSVRGPFKDRSFTTLATSEVSKILSDAFQFPEVSSDQRSFTHVVADSSGEPASVSNPARKAGIGASIGSLILAALRNSPYGPLPNEQREQQRQSSLSSLNADDGLMSTGISASKAFLDMKPDLLTFTTSTRPEIIPQIKSYSLITTITADCPSETEIGPRKIMAV